MLLPICIIIKLSANLNIHSSDRAGSTVNASASHVSDCQHLSCCINDVFKLETLQITTNRLIEVCRQKIDQAKINIRHVLIKAILMSGFAAFQNGILYDMIVNVSVFTLWDKNIHLSLKLDWHHDGHFFLLISTKQRLINQTQRNRF